MWPRESKRELFAPVNLALAPDGPISLLPGRQEESVPCDKLKPSLGGVVGRDKTSSGLCFNVSK